MADATDKYIGARIAERRDDRHLTQQGLAMLANVSKSLVSKVECGQKPATPEFIAACARALGVAPAELLGQPYLDEMRKDQVDILINPIREALSLHNLGHDPSVRPRSLDEISSDRDRVCGLVHKTDLKAAAIELPALMVEAVSVAHESDDPRAWAILVGLDRVAFNVTSKLGFHDLSVVAASRAEYAAERAQDPLIAAMPLSMQAIACLRSGDFSTGKRLEVLGFRCMEDADPGLERDAAMGRRCLSSALIEARMGNMSEAESYFKEAERYASRTGDVTPERWLHSDPPAEISRDRIGYKARGIHWYVFGPTNVGVHRVSSLADRNNYGKAIAEASKLHIPQNWPVIRAGQFYVDVARSYLWTGKDDAAFRSLLQASKLAPQQTRYHPQVKETVIHLRRRERTRRGSLAHFAEWVGV
ncbi:helix-turn-helix domain-containing protein [Streptomyces sp. B1866]|uniref:helix-turn-helix domain-containing protein n=1 Tax=Streptomyces sp. B1866 TaxID=3075431 RepID=UPI00288C88CA|nr:helix-turn-helix domain-containing protein [Streptomyces sp. B1866]MDT3395097.1 helix-turn-helix domain-containing protein [Streptomyces sp. B1866]